MSTPPRMNSGRLVAVILGLIVVAVIAVGAVLATRHGGSGPQSQAVNAPTGTPRSSPSATASPTVSAAPVLFADDFGNPASGWAPDPGQAGVGSGSYVGGGYQVTVNRQLPVLNTFSMASPYLQRLPSVAVSAITTVTAGAPADGGGVRCDQQGRSGLRYTFEIHGDGSWVLFKLDTGVTAALAQGSNPAVLNASSANVVQGTCTESTGGTRLRMAVNGVELARVLDAHPQTIAWHTALVAYRSGSQPTTIRFASFEVRAPAS